MFPNPVVAGSVVRIARQVDTRGETRRGDVGAPGRDLPDGFLACPHGVEAQCDPQMFGEATREFVGRTLWTVAAEVIGVRAVARHDPQLPRLEDLLQQPGRLGTGPEQQGRDQRKQGLHGRSMVAIEYAALGRGTEVVITAPTRNRMGA